MFKHLFLITLFLFPFCSFSQPKLAAREVWITPNIGLVPQDVLGETGILFTPGNASQYGIPVALGLKTEAFIKERISIKLDLNFSYNGYKKESGYTRTTQKARALIGANWYFEFDENLIGYFTLNAGVKNVRRVEIDTGVYGTPDHEIFDLSRTLIPFTIRMGWGGMWYVKPRIGLMYEFGFGGGTPLQFGMQIKLFD